MKIFAVFEDHVLNQKLASLVIPIALQQFMLAVEKPDNEGGNLIWL